MRVFTVTLTYCESIQAENEEEAIDIAYQNYEANHSGSHDLEAQAEELSEEEAKAQGFDPE